MALLPVEQMAGRWEAKGERPCSLLRLTPALVDTLILGRYLSAGDVLRLCECSRAYTRRFAAHPVWKAFCEVGAIPAAEWSAVSAVGSDVKVKATDPAAGYSRMRQAFARYWQSDSRRFFFGGQIAIAGVPRDAQGTLQWRWTVMGPSRAGKSTFMRVARNGALTASEVAALDYSETIGAAFCTLDFRLRQADTAGGERYASIAVMYYRHGDALVMAFDLTDATSLEQACNRLREVLRCNAAMPVLLLGMKSDLTGQRKVTPEQGRAVAAEFGPAVQYAECSAVRNRGVIRALSRLAAMTYAATERDRPPPIEPPPKSSCAVQ